MKNITVTSPLEARQNTPIFLYILIILGIIGIICVIGLFVKKMLDYRKTDVYINKEKNRKTKRKDILKLEKDCKLTSDESKLLLKFSSLISVPNLLYYLKNNQNLQQFFRDIYYKLKEIDAEPSLINDAFKLSYKLENCFSQTITILSTRQISNSTVLFYMTNEGEQFPFYVYKNQEECLFLEIPEFFYQKSTKPAELEKIPFSFKTSTGLNYSFVTRVIRYQENKGSNKNYLMVIAHSENLSVQVQRHYKRETIECDAYFSPVRVSKNVKTSKDMFIYSDKSYKGKLINISGGGCCLKTRLPIRENQNIGISIPSIKIDNRIVGVIKKTRRLSDGNFALHIQFLQYSMEDQNKILAFVYKYDL